MKFQSFDEVSELEMIGLYFEAHLFEISPETIMYNLHGYEIKEIKSVFDGKIVSCKLVTLHLLLTISVAKLITVKF